MPGGLSYWQAIETIETLFANPHVIVISADVNEIVAQEDTPLTQFTAAGLATKIVASHVLARREGRWKASSKATSEPMDKSYFQRFNSGLSSAS